MPHAGGRPVKWPDPQTFQQTIDQYFSVTPQDSLTVTGLALSLGMTREGLQEYQAKPEFTDLVKRAKARVEHRYELGLCGKYVIGCIFALKNMGWSDRQEIEYTDRSRGQIDAGQSEVKEVVAELAKRKRSLLKVVTPIK